MAPTSQRLPPAACLLLLAVTASAVTLPPSWPRWAAWGAAPAPPSPAAAWLHAVEVAAAANADAAAALRAATLALTAADASDGVIETRLAAALRAAVEAAAAARPPRSPPPRAPRALNATAATAATAWRPPSPVIALSLILLAYGAAAPAARLAVRLTPALRAHVAACLRGGRVPPFPLARRRAAACAEDACRAAAHACLAAALGAACVRGSPSPSPGQAFLLCCAGWAAAGWAAADAARALRDVRGRATTPPVVGGEEGGGPAGRLAARAAARLAPATASPPRSPRPHHATTTWNMLTQSPLTPRRRRWRRHSVAGAAPALPPATLVRLPPPKDTTTDPAPSAPPCRVCWDAPRGVAVLPCGHVGMCPPCALRLFGGGRHGADAPPPVCPFCSQQVVDVARVYIV